MKVTKKLKGEYLKHKLTTSEGWAIKALMVVYKFQTAEEQNVGTTKDHNNVGFTGTDGRFFSSLARQYEVRNKLTPKQMEFVMKRMKKYWNQLLMVSDEKKLVNCMLKDGWITDKDAEEFEQQLFLRII